MMDLLNNMVMLDAMGGLINTGNSFLKWLQRGAIIAAAIGFCVGGYYLILGGVQGRQKSIAWFVGGALGLVVVLGAYALAQGLSENVKFGG